LIEKIQNFKLICTEILGEKLAKLMGLIFRDAFLIALIVTVLSATTRWIHYQLDLMDPNKLHYIKLRELILSVHEGLIVCGLITVGAVSLSHLYDIIWKE
jgi:hypothetical protein